MSSTTTGSFSESESSKKPLPDEWLEIEFSELAEMGLNWSPSFHFGKPQIQQWHDRKYCSAQAAQESIWHFTFHLKTASPSSFRTGPLNFFMGVMARDKYFARPEGYLSPEERALQRRIESERKAAERKREMQSELFELTFEKWFESMTGNEINALTPNFRGLTAKKSVLRDQFKEQFALLIRDNPTVDVRELKLNSRPSESLVTETPSSVMSDSLPSLRKLFVQLNEESRELVNELKIESRPSVKNQLNQSLSIVLQKRQELVAAHPALTAEIDEIEKAFKDFPNSERTL